MVVSLAHVNLNFLADSAHHDRTTDDVRSSSTAGSEAVPVSRTMRIVSAVLLATTVAACTHRSLPDNFRVAVPSVPPAIVSSEIPLGIGDVVEVSYFRSFDVEGSYRLGTGDVLEIVHRTVAAGDPYRLAVGDQLEVVVRGAEGTTYQLQVGDEISVVVPTRPDLSHQGMILRDGSIVLPAVGRVEIRGLTVPQAVAVLERRYRTQLDTPRIDLLVTKSVVSEVREDVTVLPDGTGTLPLLGAVPLRGRTVAEVVSDLSKRYFAHYYRPQVDVLITRANPTVTHKVTLLPDGRVTLPLVGAVRLGGMTVEEAAAALTKLYSGVDARSQVDVLVMEPGKRVDKFFEVLIENPLGAVRDATITDDGLLRLPLIQPIAALNKPFSEVSAQIDRAYAQVLPELEVSTVFALRRSQRKVTVLGEVARAGMFDVLQPISVLEAIALGGGFTDRAWRGQVLLLHPDYREQTLTVRVVDMSKGLRILEPALLGTAVRPQDIVYVPRSRISDINVFVQQFITSVIPFNLRIEIVTGGR